MRLTKCAFVTVVLLLILSLLPVSANAATIVNHGWGKEGSEVSFRLDDKGVMTIFGTGEMEDMPHNRGHNFMEYVEHNYWPVTAVIVEEGITYIGDEVFYEAKQLKSVTLANSVERIGFRAFSDCPKLTTIKFGNGLIETDIEVFSYCESLTSVTLPNVDVDYGRFFFGHCTNLKNVTIPSAQTSIAASMFENCRSITSITLPKYITIIGGSAFQYCTSLRNINIPNSVTEIGNAAFSSCESLTSLTIPGSVLKIGARAFEHCYNLEKLTLSEGIRELGDSLFEQHCFKLKSVTLPSTITEINNAFYMATSLKSITFQSDAPEFLPQAFSDVTATVRYPNTYDGWTSNVLQNYGGTLTWVPYHLCNPNKLIPVYNADAHTHSWTCSCGKVTTENCRYTKNILTEATRNQYGFREFTCSICSGYYQEPYAYRLYGTGRCETALAAAEELKSVLGKDKFDNVIIASGTNFADALAGSYLAAKKDAPILLYTKGYAGSLASFIDNNLNPNGTVYILGGTAAVASDMESALIGYSVTRLAGADRFATNQAILEEAGVSDEDILICTAYNFADSLSASAVGLPILLVGNELTEAQIQYLSNLGGNNMFIIGGAGAVSAEMEESLQTFGNVQRISGPTRSDTSIAVATQFFAAPSRALLAYSLKFPDGLCGGPLAYALGAPLLLVTPGMEHITAEYISSNPISNGIALGGTASLTDASVNTVLSLR